MTAAAAAMRDGLGRRPGDVPGALGEQLDRPVERLGLHVLGQRDGHGAGLHRVGEGAHRAEQGGGQLLGPVDPVEEAGQRPERVVDGDVRGIRLLELLEHRRRDARREGARGQQQHRDPVDRRQRGAGEHVRRAGADGRGAHPGLEAVALAGVADGRVHHGLLVAGQHVGQRVVALAALEGELLLEQRLPHAGDVAVAEDAEAPGEQPLPLAVALAPLLAEEPHHCLADGQPQGVAHVSSLMSSPNVCCLRTASEGPAPGRPRCRAPRCGPGRHRSSTPAPVPGQPSR